jgi:hypothetical protein
MFDAWQLLGDKPPRNFPLRRRRCLESAGSCLDGPDAGPPTLSARSNSVSRPLPPVLPLVGLSAIAVRCLPLFLTSADPISTSPESPSSDCVHNRVHGCVRCVWYLLLALGTLWPSADASGGHSGGEPRKRNTKEAEGYDYHVHAI